MSALSSLTLFSPSHSLQNSFWMLVLVTVRFYWFSQPLRIELCSECRVAWRSVTRLRSTPDASDHITEVDRQPSAPCNTMAAGLRALNLMPNSISGRRSQWKVRDNYYNYKHTFYRETLRRKVKVRRGNGRLIKGWKKDKLMRRTGDTSLIHISFLSSCITLSSFPVLPLCHIIHPHSPLSPSLFHHFIPHLLSGLVFRSIALCPVLRDSLFSFPSLLALLCQVCAVVLVGDTGLSSWRSVACVV